eukprot:GEMP01022762.1.p1 GENE.GEMP01022762.1~~GEMP01022762.1.p1  ORF type:complete len:619 (+),score=85.63 GEMP01022762.1:240-2096(+)
MGACNCVEASSIDSFGSCIPIFFGSRTGGAERFADMLHSQAEECKIRTRVVNLSDFASHWLQDDKKPKMDCSVAIFVVATYGAGVPTANAKEFFAWLKNVPGPNSTFQKLNYALYGLGNSDYSDTFCNASVLLDTELLRLGANRIGEFGKGDAKHSVQMENQFEQWSQETLATLRPICPERTRLSSLTSQDVQETKPHDDNEVPQLAECESVKDLPTKCAPMGHDVMTRWYFEAKEVDILSVEHLIPDGPKDTVEVTIQMPPDVDPESVLAINCEVLPENDPKAVKRFADVFGWKLHNHITWIDGTSCFPTPCTVEAALTKYCDINCLPPRNTMERMINEICTNVDDPVKKMLARKVYSSLVDAKVTLVEFAEQFLKGYTLPLNLFLTRCPRLQQRTYSVCSTYLEDETRFQLLLNQHTEELQPAPSCMPDFQHRRTHEGVLSTWFTKRHPKKVMMTFVESTFRLPSEPTTPMILVGTGVGIAPLMSIVRHMMKIPSFDRPSSCLLFFGNTHPDKDYLYKEELAAAKAGWPALEVITAFSRTTEQKVYVQHRILQNQLKVAANIDEAGCIFACGSVAMANSVRDALEEVFTVQRVNATCDLLIGCGRYMNDAWIKRGD